jgi:hypothetical protein
MVRSLHRLDMKYYQIMKKIVRSVSMFIFFVENKEMLLYTAQLYPYFITRVKG